MKRRRVSLVGSSALLLVTLLVGIANGQTVSGRDKGPAPPNVLLLIADDLGVDRVGAYGEHPDPGNTPVIDSLAANGLLFRNCWSNPSCSPSRATMLTGRYAFRTGIGKAVNYEGSPFELSADEVSIADLLNPTYETAALGKWHVSAEKKSATAHPQLMGFDRFLGNMKIFPGFTGHGYYEWEKVIDGQVTLSKVYATTDRVDDALALIDSYTDPWFLWVAFNAPHAPYHKPPPELHSYSLPPLVTDDIPLHMKAMMEALDTEIGRLLASMDPQVLSNTIVIFVGDNGGTKSATTAPFDKDHAKNTVYEGGINVPLIISGPGVAVGAECAGLVNTTDLFATIADIAGAGPVSAEDSVSLVPYFASPGLASLRPWAFAESFTPNGHGIPGNASGTVRDGQHKLMRTYDLPGGLAEECFFDLAADPFEAVDLLDGSLTPGQEQAYEQLSTVLEGLFGPPGPHAVGRAGSASKDPP